MYLNFKNKFFFDHNVWSLENMKKWNLKKLWTLFINYSYLFSLKSCFWTLNLQNEYLHDIIIIIVKNSNNAHFSSSKVCFDTILSGNATGDNVSALNPSQIVATVVACAQLWQCRNKMCLLGSWASPFYASVWNPSCSPPAVCLLQESAV